MRRAHVKGAIRLEKRSDSTSINMRLSENTGVAFLTEYYSYSIDLYRT